MKRALLLGTMFCVLSFYAHAQQFDWVRTYTGPEPQDYPRNYIVASATDSQGNLYVAGQFAFSATFDGQDLIPFSPWGGNVYIPNACIMKLSPSGELLWKRILHANQERVSYITDIQLVGDTALWVCADIDLPRDEYEYLYFYDTLITPSNRSAFLDADSISVGGSLAVTAFDTEGNRKENYILHTAYKDNEGRLITLDRMTGRTMDTAYVLNNPFNSGAFHVDNQGNIYLGHMVQDEFDLHCDTCEGGRIRLNLNNGLIGEWMVMVNGQLRFSDTPSSHPTMSNYRIMKFSPHFNEMLACRYVFENEIGQWSYYADQQLITDISGSRVFLLFNVDMPTELTEQPLSGSDSMFVRFNNMDQGVVVEYDSQLQPLEVYQIAQVQPLSGRAEWNSFFGKMVIDADSNLLFILGDIADNNLDIDLTINGQAVEIGTSNAFFLKTRIGNPTILADGFARSDQFTSLLTSKDHKGAVASKGRLFAMVDYACNIQWSDTSIVLPRNQFGGCNEGEGVFVWSYEGEELDFIDLKKCSMLNPVSSSLALHDSVLYVCGGLTEDVRIADTVIHPTSYSIAYMARYVDTAFMMQYVYMPPEDTTHHNPIDTSHVSIRLMDNEGALVVYPNPFKQKITIHSSGASPIASAWLTDMMGRREEAKLTATGNEEYSLDLTSTPQGVYLLTLTTITGKQYTVRLMKQ